MPLITENLMWSHIQSLVKFKYELFHTRQEIRLEILGWSINIKTFSMTNGSLKKKDRKTSASLPVQSPDSKTLPVDNNSSWRSHKPTQTILPSYTWLITVIWNNCLFILCFCFSQLQLFMETKQYSQNSCWWFAGHSTVGLKAAKYVLRLADSVGWRNSTNELNLRSVTNLLLSGWMYSMCYTMLKECLTILMYFFLKVSYSVL